MSRLIHLNGPPGIGKSTIARRYAAEHPGVLCCDVDALRTFVGGWEDDVEADVRRTPRRADLSPAGTIPRNAGTARRST